jgi:hypothetical protein
MADRNRTIAASLAVVAILSLLGIWLHRSWQKARLEQARSQVQRWAERLDSQTIKEGFYMRPEQPDLPESDPWGTPLRVHYSQGGMAETLTVRSAGPDRMFHSPDDITATGLSANVKGIGAGMNANVEQFAQKGARGDVKGAMEGVKDGIKDAFKKPPSRKEPRDPG